MSLQISLTKGCTAIVDEIDADLSAWKWRANGIETHRYAVRLDNITKENVIMHRVIMSRILGRNLEKREFVDHIDGNTLNNVRANLRLADYSENGRNRKRQSNNKSGFKGVYKADKKWRASIRLHGKQIHLGGFDTPEEAYEAYKAAAVKYHGEFANFGDKE